MVGTILPIVHGGRREGKFSMLLVLHACGYVSGAAILGGLLGSLGRLFAWHSFDSPGNILIPTATGVASLAFSSRELDLTRFACPQFRKQVPGKWRSVLPHWAMGLLYGMGLGVGIFTYIPTGTFYVVTFWVVISGDALTGAIGMAAFGLGRALPLLWFGLRPKSPEECSGLIETLPGWMPLMHLTNGLILAFAGSLMMVVGFGRF